MAEKKEYWLRVQDILVPVSQEVYRAYYGGKRQEKTQMEKNARHGVVSYHALDEFGASGEEWIPDSDAPAIEDAVVHRVLCEQLHGCINRLSNAEQELIMALYFEGLSERKLSSRTGIPQRTIHDRKVKVLQKLKKMMSGSK